MTIKVGDYDVLDNGVVLSVNNLPIHFNFENEGEEVTLTITFSSDIPKDENGNERALFDSRVVSGQVMNITLRGWDNPLGTTVNEPLFVGSIGGRELKLLFRSYGMGSDKPMSRMFAYTWLLGDSV